MNQKREQMWWLAACVLGLLVAAWAAGGFIGPLIAVFIVLFLAGAVLVEFGGGVAPHPSGVAEPETDPAADEQSEAEPDVVLAPEVEIAEADPESEADLREAVSSLA